MTNEPTAIHRTHIVDASREEGRAAWRSGRSPGAAIKLWPLTAGEESLTVGEGIETVLAAVKLGVG